MVGYRFQKFQKQNSLYSLNKLFAGTDHYDDPELKDLTDNFKDQAAKLVDMLDISIPVVAKLKVS